MKWWNELRDPELKCKRLGHIDKVHKVVIMKDDDYYCAGQEYYAEIIICKKCGRKLEPQNLKYKDRYTSVSMPDSKWREIKEQGYTIMNYE